MPESGPAHDYKTENWCVKRKNFGAGGVPVADRSKTTSFVGVADDGEMVMRMNMA